MRFRLPTASALERALACPPSIVLPQIFAGVGEDAQRGTAIGAFVRDILAGEPWEAALARVPRDAWRSTCRALDFAAICGDLKDVRAEVAYALDPGAQTGRVLGLNLGRRYPELAAGEFCGTNDLEGRTETPSGLREVVGDLKSGREVTSCAVNPQMQFHAAARMFATGAPEVEARVLYVREDGRVFRDSHVFTAFELESFSDALVELVERIGRARASLAAGEMPEVHAGTWCRYCPALQTCPAYTALARAMLPELQDVAARVEAMTPEQGGAAWTKAKTVERLLETVLDSLKARARQTPLVTRPGKVVREIPWTSTEFSSERAVELLRERGATREEIDALFVRTASSQVREVNEVQKPKRRRSA